MEKHVLYHGSPTKNLKILVPKIPHKGSRVPFVFATPQQALASVFMFPEEVKFSIGRFDDVWHVVISNPREWLLTHDQGGSTYEVTAELFMHEARSGLGDTEWITDKPVMPLREISYTSTLDALLKQEVQVFFVDFETLKLFNELQDHGKKMLRTMQSENKIRNINVRDF